MTCLNMTTLQDAMLMQGTLTQEWVPERYLVSRCGLHTAALPFMSKKGLAQVTKKGIERTECQHVSATNVRL